MTDQLQIRRAALLGALSLTALLAACGGGHAAIAQATAGLPSGAAVINGISIPPDPGPANDATLVGIDTTGTGVRDDVYRVIAAKYGANTVEWKAVLQAAQAAQLSVAANGDTTLSDQANIAEMRAGGCLAFVQWNDGNLFKPGNRPIDYVFAITADTPARLAAFQATESVMTSSIPADGGGHDCEN